MSKIGTLRNKETEYLKNDGRLDVKEAKSLVKLATAKDATKDDKAAVLAMLKSDAFDGTKVERQALAKSLGVKKLETHPLNGMTLGWLTTPGAPGIKVDVFVKKTLGPPQGFGDKFQAVAQARLANSDTATVVEHPKGRWHAVEMNIPLENNATYNTEGETAAGSPVNFESSDNPLRSQEHIGRLDPADFAALKKSAESADTIEGKRAAYKELAARTLGVSPNDIVVIDDPSQRQAGKININIGNPEKGGLTGDGRMGEAKTNENFDPKNPPAIELSPKAFDTMEDAMSTLFHEGLHVEHYKKAQDWYADYATTDTSPTPKEFNTWIVGQAEKKKLTYAEADSLGGLASGALGGTEAYANTGAAMASLAGNTPNKADDATVQLKNYAASIAAGKYAYPSPQVQLDVETKLKAAYHTLSEDDRAAFKAALAAAVKETPTFWLKGFKPD